MSSLVKYHNNFIEAIYKTDLLCKKLLIGISHKIQRTGKYGTPVEFSASEICDLVGIERGSYRYLESAIERLMGTIITIRSPYSNEWIKFNMLGKSEYKMGVLKVSIPDDMKPFLTELKKRFTTYHIENIKPLKSDYSIKIYELLAQYRNTHHKIREMKLDELKKLLGCENKYKRYNNFRTKVLEICKKELKTNCDVYFEYESIKFGNSVTAIKFKIKEQKITIIEQNKLSKNEKNEFLKKQYNDLRSARVTEKLNDKNSPEMGKILDIFNEDYSSDELNINEDGTPKDIVLRIIINGSFMDDFPKFEEWEKGQN
jgi:plasmid replication initiation protein